METWKIQGTILETLFYWYLFGGSIWYIMYNIYDDKCTYLCIYVFCIYICYIQILIFFLYICIIVFVHVRINQFAGCGDLWRPCNMIVVLLLLSCLILPDMKAFVVLFALPFSAFQSQIRRGARDLRNSVNVDIIPAAAQLRHFVEVTKVTKAWSSEITLSTLFSELLELLRLVSDEERKQRLVGASKDILSLLALERQLFLDS